MLLAFDLERLLSLAEQSNCLIELVPEVGDFVAAEDPCSGSFRVGRIGGGHFAKFSGVEPGRAVEQDPMFAFRIMVDIASRLSLASG